MSSRSLWVWGLLCWSIVWRASWLQDYALLKHDSVWFTCHFCANNVPGHVQHICVLCVFGYLYMLTWWMIAITLLLSLSLSLPPPFSFSHSVVDASPCLSDCSEVSGALLFLLMHSPLQQLRQLSEVFDHYHIAYCCFLCVQWAIYKPLLSQKSSHSTEQIARLCLN